MSFFTPNERSSYTSSYSWKSQATLLTNKFERMCRLVRYVAPEQFRNPARPGTGPCCIVPTTVLEYVEHNKDILKMATEQMEKNLAARKEAQRIKDIDRDGERQKPIESHFGKNAKIFSDRFSPVLCQPTMWSEEYKNYHTKMSEWPTQIELQECGDRRENDQLVTRCGRYLPPPRETVMLPLRGRSSINRDVLVETRVLKRFLPLDEPGPIFHNGPSPMEVTHANGVMDSDHTFEGRACDLLGSGLMQEVGDQKPPFVPVWLAERRRQEAFEQARRWSRTLAPAPGAPIMMVPMIHYH